MSGSLDIAAAARSELGQKKSNEDKVRICREGPRWVAILADGAGGHRGGAEASRRAVDAIEASLCDEDADFSARSLTSFAKNSLKPLKISCVSSSESLRYPVGSSTEKPASGSEYFSRFAGSSPAKSASAAAARMMQRKYLNVV